MQHVANELGHWSLALLPLLGCLLGCGDEGGAAPRASLDLDGVPPSSWQQAGSDPCLMPDVGCPCEEEGVALDCGTVTELRGDHELCSPGTRSCAEGVWGECTADTSLGGALVLPAD